EIWVHDLNSGQSTKLLATDAGQVFMTIGKVDVSDSFVVSELSQFSGRLGGLRGPTFDLTSREGWS
ncbi:MAG: hypothetical protein ACYTG0_46865, partial [Planctomycetota bacterium]